MSQHAVELGDVVEVLKGYQDNSFDAVLCDTPYGLGTREPTGEELVAYLQGEELDTGGDFMGKKWSVPSVGVWREMLRVLKPGAPVLAFGGTRTFDLMSLGIRAAGFEIRDVLSWLYGQGFPKSLNISKAIDAKAGATRKVVGHAHRKATGRLAQGEGGYAFAEDYSPTAASTDLAREWDGYGTALKPAWEPCILARKPLDGTVAANVAKWGVGGLAIDGCRIDGVKPLRETTDGVEGLFGMGSRRAVGESSQGRWPANVLLDEEAAAVLDAQSGNRPGMSGGGKHKAGAAKGMFGAIDGNDSHIRGDNGGASRFFYVAKASQKERNFGCDDLPLRSASEMTDSEEGQARLNSPRTGAGRTGGARNHHPTVKPIALMTYLARLIMPPKPGAILVPFSGSGSEMLGALEAGWPAVLGIERESEYVEIARARLKARAA